MLVKNDYKNNTSKIEVLTAKELKVVLKCGINRAYDLMKSPAFPSIKIGGRYIVTNKALEEWLRIHEGKNYLI